VSVFGAKGGQNDREIGMKSLFVGNMNFQTSEGELRALFEPFGAVTRVHMAMDRETGRARGFAFVEMPNDEEATKAISGLDGSMVGGRQLKVNEARPRGESGGPPRGGNRGGGGYGGDKGGGGASRGKGGGRGRDRFSTEDYSGSVRQPREPRW
jgi:RNA recognition motif-containing protein